MTPGYEPTIGGAETYAVSLAGGLARSGCEVTVATDGSAGAAGVTRHRTGVTVARIPRPAGWTERVDSLLWEQTVFGLLPALVPLARSADVIHANSHDTAVVASMLAADAGVPAVATFHEQDPESAPGGVGRCRLVYGTLPLAAIVCGSRYYLELAVRNGSGGREALIPHGIDCALFRPGDRALARAELGLPAAGPLVVCASRFKRRKGVLELVEALAEVSGMVGAPVHAVIAGTPSSGSASYADQVLRRIDELGMAGRIMVRGDLGWSDMPRLWQAADVAVQASYAEGLGLSVLEAMACEVPAVATDVPGLREIVTDGETGLLVPARNVQELAKAIARVIDDRVLARRLGSAGRDFVRRRHHLVDAVAGTVAVHRAAIERARPGGGVSR